MSTASSFSSFIESLEAAGWRKEWMIREPLLLRDGKPWRPDLILRIGLYPVAFIEVSSQIEARQPTDASVTDDGQGLLRLVWDGGIVKDLDKPQVKWKSLPSPEKLWKYMGRVWDDSDPRLLRPLVTEHLAMGLPHSLALRCMLDALLAGERRVHVGVALGKTSVALEVGWRMLRTGRFERALVLVDHLDEATQAQYRLSAQQDIRVAEAGSTPSAPGFEIASMGWFMARGWQHLLESDRERYDLLIVPHLRKQPAMDRLLDHFSQAGLVGLHSSFLRDLPEAYGRRVYEQSVEEVLSEAAWQPPPGTRRVWLEDIARITQGATLFDPRGQEKEKVSASIVSGADVVRKEGRPGKTELVPRVSLTRGRLQAGDILLPGIVAESRVRLPVAVVPDLGDEVRVAANTVMVVRIIDSQVDRQELIDYLSGPLAMTFLRAGSSTLGRGTRIYPSSLAKMPVFLRLGREGAEEPRRVNLYSMILETFRKEIVPALENLGNSDDPPVEEARQVAEALRRVLLKLEPPSFDARVLQGFPTPIALAWRRYRDARFNPYEQVSRLRDVFEAVAFFVYNVMFMDYLCSPSLKRCVVSDPDARRAWRGGGSMSDRVNFIDSMLTSTSPSELFLSGLHGTGVVAIMKELQGKFRNRLAHSATPSESLQHRLIGEYEPVVMSLLQQLSFLDELTLARVPVFFRRDGKTMQRVEIYRGVMSEVAERPVGTETIATAADCTHLVVIDDVADRSLDLYPVYQLVSNEGTRYESHLCFMKSAKEKEKIRGEDAHTSLEVELEGYDLLMKLHDDRKT